MRDKYRRAVLRGENAKSANSKNKRRIAHSEVQPSPRPRLWLSERQEGPPPLVLGRTALEEIAQLLDHHGQTRRLPAHNGRLGPLARRTGSLQHRQSIAQSPPPGRESQMRDLH